LPDSSPVNLVTEKDTEGRVFVSTYPTMMGLIDETSDGQRRFGIGHFDLVVIDEAHRSVFQKYCAIFEYFDSLLVGLTATPKDEVDRNTYRLFDLENGVPTDAYGLDEAIRDGFLVPPKAVSVPLKFQREGIKYDELSEEDKDKWDAMEWDEDGSVPSQVEAEAVNKWLFNKDTVDKVLAHIMTHGLTVAGGDRLGKTIVFAKNQYHAEFIADRFNVNYPHYKGEFARVITFKTEYAQSLIDNFSSKEKAPHIAISVDMLDTGIDIPEIVNLVFFKLVRSKTKFWQMIGRGTRLCPNLFEPGKNKEFFYIFDYCQNLEYFSQNLEITNGASGVSLGKRLFNTRLELIGELGKQLEIVHGPAAREQWIAPFGQPETDADVRALLIDTLHKEVAAMNLDNFVVRTRRRIVEKYAQTAAWKSLSPSDMLELSFEVAGLPSEIVDEPEEAKRFDLLIYNLQLARINSLPGFERLRDQVKTIVGLLEDKAAIPMVREHMSLIVDLQTDEWWQDVTIPMLEIVRRRIRNLVILIEKERRKPVYTDFEDEMDDEIIFDLPNMAGKNDYSKFRAKAQAFLQTHKDHIAIHKLRMNVPLTITDLNELERILIENGIGKPDEISKVANESHGLGLFVRSLVGMDRGAAKAALANFLTGKHLNANQTEFMNLIINHLTEHGVIEASMLYESPFTDLAPQGPEGIFSSEQVGELITTLTAINCSAIAA